MATASLSWEELAVAAEITAKQAERQGEADRAAALRRQAARHLLTAKLTAGHQGPDTLDLEPYFDQLMDTP